MERDPVQLLDVLLQACTIAAVPPLAIAPTLRRLLGQLTVEAASDTKTAPPQGENGAAEVWHQPDDRPKAVPPPARSTAHRVPVAKAASRKPAASNGTGPALSVSQWLALRAKVEAEMRRQGLDLHGLAAAIGRTFATTRVAMRKRSPPSRPIEALLRGFVAGPGSAVEPVTSPEGDQVGNGKTTATAGPDDVRVLAVQLRRKRRPMALTATTLASQIGVDVTELDDALHGRPVPQQATERLAAWAAAG